MSLYNLLHGRNADADLLLAALELSQGDVGRFRDAFVAEGKIAVYTRNGGGNRHCWCDDGWNEEAWASHFAPTDAEELRIRTLPRVVEKESEGLTTITPHPEGGTEDKPAPVCLAPDSPDCTCPGCIIEHRLPRHPHYLTDADDEFDSTYATIWFSIPESLPEGARELMAAQDIGEWDPDALWAETIAKLREGT